MDYQNHPNLNFHPQLLEYHKVMSRKLCKHKKNKEKAFIKVPETTHQSVPK